VASSPDMLKKKQIKQIIIDHLRGKISHNGQIPLIMYKIKIRGQ